MQNAKFNVRDMHCGGCVRHVTEGLRRLDGVAVRQVTVGAAEVSFDPAKTTAQAITAALADAGYPAALVAAPACQVESGRRGAELLIAELAGRTTPAPVVQLHPHLVVRATTASPKHPVRRSVRNT